MGVEAISTQGEFDAAVTGAPCSMLVVVCSTLLDAAAWYPG